MSRTIGPVTKASALGGSVATFIAWVVAASTGVEMPVPVLGALAIICTAVGSLVGGWLVKPGTGKRIAGEGDK